MAIRYNKAYNKEISAIVKNFNQKRNRAIQQGFKNVPSKIKVSDLKARYTSRKLMNEQLKLMKEFSAGGNKVLKEVENRGGAESIDWEFKYLKSNERLAREYFVREFKMIGKRIGSFPGERQRLDTIARKINLLDMDVDYMSQSQFNSYRSAINEFIQLPSRQKAGYRGFLSEVDWVMDKVGIDEESRNEVFRKLNKLSPQEFFNMYENSEIVKRIYDLADSPEFGKMKLNTDIDDAKKKVDSFIESLDILIEQAKRPKEIDVTEIEAVINKLK